MHKFEVEVPPPNDNDNDTGGYSSLRPVLSLYSAINCDPDIGLDPKPQDESRWTLRDRVREGRVGWAGAGYGGGDAELLVRYGR